MEVALAAADGDLNVAVEILSQQVCIVCHKHHLVHFLVLIADITEYEQGWGVSVGDFKFVITKASLEVSARHDLFLLHLEKNPYRKPSKFFKKCV